MKLVDLKACFVGTGGEGISDVKTGKPVPYREGIGVGFDCPCGCEAWCYIPFHNPLDGGPPSKTNHPKWQRTGETLEDLTLTPSIYRKHGCGWHGFLTNGDFKSV